jgi:glycosyltransferase involved in cell wall biosynthesis
MISIVVPAYNEELRIERCIQLLLRVADEIVIVSDGDDATGIIVRELESVFSNIILVESSRRLGKGKAFFEGFREARGDKIFLVDADVPVRLSDFGKFAGLLDKYPVVIGSRTMKGSKSVNQPMRRRILSQGFRDACRFFLGVGFDTQCGFKAFRREVLEAIADEMTVGGYAFDVELLLRTVGLGYTILEVPVTYSYDKNSKVKFNTSLRMLWDVFRLSRSSFRPEKRKDLNNLSLEDF